MKLERIHVYAVVPQRISEANIPPNGGNVKLSDLSPEFLRYIEQYTIGRVLDEQPAIAFEQSVPSKGPHPVREKIVSFAFENTKVSSESAVSLADRLSKSMDGRSHTLLLLMTVHANGEKRRVTLWAFPKDEPIQFQTEKKVMLKNIENAFSTSSTYTKCARFEGKNSPKSFSHGTVIDGVGSNSSDPAQYWTSRFLQGTLILTSAHGTHQLAKTLKSVIAACDDPADRMAVSLAVIAVRASQQDTWTFNELAEAFLPEELRPRFLDIAPPRERDTKFKIDKSKFERDLGMHVFTTVDGVVITAPFESTKSTVKVAGDSITVTGIVASESFSRGRTPRARKAQ